MRAKLHPNPVLKRDCANKPSRSPATLGVFQMLSRRVLLSLILLLSSWGLRAETPWLEIAQRISEYAAKPSPTMAIAALNVIPETSVSFTNSREENEAIDAIYALGPMQVLEQRVLMKERESVELAFRMRHIADGAFLEDLDIILGKLIRVDPELFLSELQRARVPPRAMDGLVGNLGDAYVDQMERQCKEMRLRRQTLNRVLRQSLVQTKGQAITALAADSSFCQDAQPGVPGDVPQAARL